MIRRTIRLIREVNPGIKIHVITWHNELKFNDVIVIDTKTQPDQMTDTMLFSASWWSDRNIFLAGDVVFGKDTMQKILDYRTDEISMFYRDIYPTKDYAERFAFRFTRADIEVVSNLLKKSSRMFKGTTYEQDFGFTKVCYATHDERVLWLIAPIEYTDGTHRYIPFIRSFRDFCIHHVYPFWKPRRIFTLIPVSDDITTDIDTLKEYEEFLALGVV